MTPLLITNARIHRTKSGLGYQWRFECDGHEYDAISDTSLGAIMGAFREILRLIAGDHGVQLGDDPQKRTGSIHIDQLSIERTVTQSGYRLFMQSKDYTYTCFVDYTVESWIAAMSAAMKFFALKYGMIYLYDEVARNVQAAHEDGFVA